MNYAAIYADLCDDAAQNLDAGKPGMWRYHANRMDARRSQFDLGRVNAYI